MITDITPAYRASSLDATTPFRGIRRDVRAGMLGSALRATAGSLTLG